MDIIMLNMRPGCENCKLVQVCHYAQDAVGIGLVAGKLEGKGLGNPNLVTTALQQLDRDHADRGCEEARAVLANQPHVRRSA